MPGNADSEARYLALVKTSLALLPDIPTGWEISGQTCDITERQARIREWRKALMAAARDVSLPPPNDRSGRDL